MKRDEGRKAGSTRDEGPAVFDLDAEVEGEGALEPPPLADAELWAALQRTFESAKYRPPVLPAIATELMALSTRPDVEIDQLVKLLEKDVPLAGRVLKLSRSPLYGALSPACTLRQAIVRMGLSELRDVVIESAMNFRVFKATGYSEAVDRVRLHSTMTAYIARAITRFSSFEAEYAFLCGLLHDVGLWAALVALGDVPKGQPLRPVVELWPTLHAMHEQLGGAVVATWKLPPEVEMVVSHHHTLKVGGRAHPVAAIVCLAECLAVELDCGLVPRARDGANPGQRLFGQHRVDEVTEQQQMLALATLNFDERTLGLVRKAATHAVEALRAAG